VRELDYRKETKKTAVVKVLRWVVGYLLYDHKTSEKTAK
jgi:hypothetical protein